MSLFRRKRMATGTCVNCASVIVPAGTALCDGCKPAVTLSGAVLWSAVTQISASISPVFLGLHSARAGSAPELEVVTQDDLLQGTKYACLWQAADDRPEFRGVGHPMFPYRTEAYAQCGNYQSHESPAAGCQCGFWVATRPESQLAQWTPSWVALEVEFGGRVLDCGREPLPAPPWGYRAQWQRVLSVSLSQACGVASLTSDMQMGGTTARNAAAAASYAELHDWGALACRGPVRWLAAAGRQVCSACEQHAATAAAVVRKPVAWLREGLQTEVRPGTITDDAPAPVLQPHAAAKRQVRKHAVPAGSPMLPYTLAAGGLAQGVLGQSLACGASYSVALPEDGWNTHTYTVGTDKDGMTVITEEWYE